jgi:ZIP family zinc transporter
MTLFLIAIATFTATLIGGFLALRLKDSLHLILGFSAGAVIGVVFFDILPEALELTKESYEASTVLTMTAIGFSLYLLFDRFVLRHSHGHDHGHDHDIQDTAGAASLTFHSFLDGIGIGLAFQVSTTVGAIVAAAVLTHDFSDGINTVNMILRHHGEKARAIRWLIFDATAPVLGIISTFFFTIPDTSLGLFLSLFAGFFLYIGASDLIPESTHGHPVRWTTFATIVGVATLYLAVTLAGL